MTTPFLASDLKRFEGCTLAAIPDARSPLAKACVAARLGPLHYAQLPDWQSLSGDPWTIGYGHTGPEVKPSLEITQDQAEMDLALDIRTAIHGLDNDALTSSWWRTLDDVRQDGLVEMAFNMGEHTLDEFHVFLHDLRHGDYADAAAAALDSDWAREVNGDGRADYIADLIRSGVRAPTAGSAA